MDEVGKVGKLEHAKDVKWNMNELEKVGKYGTLGEILLKFETMNKLEEVGISFTKF